MRSCTTTFQPTMMFMRDVSRNKLVHTLGMLVLSACDGLEPSGVEPYDGPPRNLPLGVEAPSNARGENAELMAVGYVGPCSGVLVDVGGAPDAPAHALTSGHCLDQERWSPNAILRDLHAEELPSFQANTFWDTEDATLDFPVARVEYQTMHLKDIAILRLDATNAEVSAHGIVPFRLAQTEVAPGSPISIVGNPGNAYLKVSRCTSGEQTYVAEHEYLLGVFSNRCAGLAPGSSGSAVLNDEAEVAGVLSTASGGGRPCTRDNPCDVAQSKLVNPVAPTSYFAETTGLEACFTDGHFDLEASMCPLTKPMSTVAESGIGRYVRSRDGALARWNVSVAQSPLPHYRFKVGTARTTRCEDDQGYSETRTAAAFPTIDEVLPPNEDLYLLCVQGSADGESFSESALVFLTEVDNTPPAPLRRSDTVLSLPDMPTEVSLQVDPVEAAKLYFRLEGLNETNCAPMATDEVATTWTQFTVAKSDELQQLCVTAEDAAGNRSAPARLELFARP